jgi:hypothetical protein
MPVEINAYLRAFFLQYLRVALNRRGPLGFKPETFPTKVGMLY